MKNILALFLFISVALHEPITADYTSFSKFVITHLRLPEAVNRNCTWQYVIVKVMVDKNSTIVDYHIENKTFIDITRNFNYLKGYQFDNRLKLSSHNVVFVISLVNDRVDACDTVTNEKNKADSVFKQYKIDHTKAHPRNIYIKDIMTTVIYDSIK